MPWQKCKEGHLYYHRAFGPQNVVYCSTCLALEAKEKRLTRKCPCCRECFVAEGAWDKRVFCPNCPLEKRVAYNR